MSDFFRFNNTKFWDTDILLFSATDNYEMDWLNPQVLLHESIFYLLFINTYNLDSLKCESSLLIKLMLLLNLI